MRRILTHLLLSAALIIQGLGAVCATGPAMTQMAGMAKQAMTAGQSLAMGHAAAPSTHCKACQGCPDADKSGNDCLKSCGVPAGLPSVVAITTHIVPSDALLLPARPALVDFAQAPPTPPPIA